MHPGLELVGEMKRLRRAPEPTSAMEPWLQKAVHDKVLIEKSSGPARGPPEAPCAAQQCGNGAPAL